MSSYHSVSFCLNSGSEFIHSFISRGEACSGSAIKNWISGLRLSHIYNDAEWHGDEGWFPALKTAAEKGGTRFKRPPRDLDSPFGASA
jgi:hypothetical protein